MIRASIRRRTLREKLAVQLADSPEQTRAITRMWQKFKTGQ